MAVVDGVGRWVWIADASAAHHRGRPALFIDRDGVLTREVHFLRRPEDVSILPRAAETLVAFNQVGISVIVVTNQSGIARRYLSWGEFEQVEDEIRHQLWVEAGAHVDAVFACGYHEAGSGPLRVRDHSWCKPNPGMLLAAGERLGVRLDRSWIVGDRARDIASGRAAGLEGGAHVATGHGSDAERRAAVALASEAFPVRQFDDLFGAVALLDAMVGSPFRPWPR